MAAALNRGLSDLGIKLVHERERLLADLLCHLAGAGDTDFEPLLAETLESLAQHSYRDTDPQEVEELYARAKERLGENAAFDRQRALGLLETRLRSLPLASSQYDYAHRVLALLYCTGRGAALSGGTGPLPRSLLLERLEREAERAILGEPSYLTDTSSASGSWAEVPWSPTSELSGWSDDEAAEAAAAVPAAGEEEEQQQMMMGGEVAGVEGGGSKDVDAQRQQQQQQQQQQTAAGLPALPAPPSLAAPPELLVCRQAQEAAGGPAPPGSARSPYERSSLAVWLASRRSGGHPQRLLEPRLCFTEQELVAQVLRMLEGVARPGPAFELDAERDAYRPVPGVHLHCCSHGAARSLLGRFAALATTLRHAAAFCTGVLRGGGGGGGGGAADVDAARLRELPTVAAFAAAVSAALQSLQRQLLAAQLAAGAGAPPTLLQLAQRAEGLAPSADLLLRLTTRCAWRHSAAQSAAELLGALHAELQGQVAQARSRGGLLAALLLDVFGASARPYCDALHAWVHRGALEDPAQEFCVLQRASVAVDSTRYWTDAYKLRLCADGATPALPPFLLPLADQILAAGKSALLLQAHAAWRRGAARASADAAAAGAPSAAAQARRLELESPSKRRLSEFGALGFALAEGRGRGGCREAAAPRAPYAPLPAPAPLETWASADVRTLQRLAAEAAEAEEEVAEPPPLHPHLLRSLREQLEEAARLAAPGEALGPALAGAASAAAAAAPIPEQAEAQSPPGQMAAAAAAGDGGGEHEVLQGWLAATACDAHRLLLEPPDELPPLRPVPASPPVPPGALIQAPPAPVGSSASGSTASPVLEPTRSEGSCPGLSIGNRMRAASSARVAQATAETLDALPQLLVSPAVLPSGELEAEQRQQHAEGGCGAAGPRPPLPAPGFESSAWAQWYERTAAALSSQLQLSRGGGGEGDGKRRPRHQRQQQLASWGLPLTLEPYEPGVSAAVQMWRHTAAGAPAASSTADAPNGGPATAAPPPTPPALASEAPPLGVLLQRALLRPVADAAEAAGGRLCAALLRQGLLGQLAALRETFLLGSPLLEPFVSSLLRRISSRSGIDGVSEFELTASLQDALAAGGRADVLALAAEIVPAPAPGAGEGGAPAAAGPRVSALSRLRLCVTPAWPLSLLASESMLRQYNAVLVLLLQLRWARQSLQSVRFAGWKDSRRQAQAAAAEAAEQRAGGDSGGGGGGRRAALSAAAAAERDGLQHQMLHLADATLQYVTDRVAAAGAWLEGAVADCTSLDEMHRCREQYQRAVARYCLLGGEGVARLVHDALLKLLDASLHYCALQHQLSRVDAAAAAAADSAAAGGNGGAAGGAAAAEGPRQRPQEQQGQRLDVLALAQRRTGLCRQIGQLGREYSARQRLLLRVLRIKAAEAGGHADELRQLLGALDFNGYFAARE